MGLIWIWESGIWLATISPGIITRYPRFKAAARDHSPIAMECQSMAIPKFEPRFRLPRFFLILLFEDFEYDRLARYQVF